MRVFFLVGLGCLYLRLSVHRQRTLKEVAIVEKSVVKQCVSCVGSMVVCERTGQDEKKETVLDRYVPGRMRELQPGKQ